MRDFGSSHEVRDRMPAMHGVGDERERHRAEYPGGVRATSAARRSRARVAAVARRAELLRSAGSDCGDAVACGAAARVGKEAAPASEMKPPTGGGIATP